MEETRKRPCVFTKRNLWTTAVWSALAVIPIPILVGGWFSGIKIMQAALRKKTAH